MAQGPRPPWWDIRNQVHGNAERVAALDGLHLSDRHHLAVDFNRLHSIKVSMKDSDIEGAGAVLAVFTG